MSEFLNAINAISDFFIGIHLVPDAIGELVKDVPYLSFALGLSVFLGLVTWVIKLAVHR